MAEESGGLELAHQTDKNNDFEDQKGKDNLLKVENREADSWAETTGETEQIRGQIAETRQQMGETIDAIQEKLSFSNISEQVKETVSEQINNAVETAKDAVYGATIGKAGEFMQNLSKDFKKSNLVKMAGDNPFPFLLIGLGAGLLIYTKYNKDTVSNHRNKGNHKNLQSSNDKSNQDSMLKSAKDKVGETLQTVSGAAGSAFESISGAAGSAYESVSGAANTAYKSVGSAANSAYEGVGSAASGALEKAGNLKTQAREQYDYYIEENPLAVGAVAAALGAAVALAIPSTSYENQWMGEAHENLMSKAGDVAQGAIEKVQQVAGEVQKTIGDEIKT